MDTSGRSRTNSVTKSALWQQHFVAGDVSGQRGRSPLVSPSLLGRRRMPPSPRDTRDTPVTPPRPARSHLRSCFYSRRAATPVFGGAEAVPCPHGDTRMGVSFPALDFPEDSPMPRSFHEKKKGAKAWIREVIVGRPGVMPCHAVEPAVPTISFAKPGWPVLGQEVNDGGIRYFSSRLTSLHVAILGHPGRKVPDT